MKAIIFNSGYGNRMGEFTKTHHKSMAPLKNGETIFERQLRILFEEGIRDFIVTTGPFEEQLKTVAEKFKEANFTFVKNEIYNETNYIYYDGKSDDYLILPQILTSGILDEYLI